MDSELVARISSFLGIPDQENFKPRFPKKPRESHRNFQSNGCDEGSPAEATSETRATLGASSSVGSAEKEMVQHLPDVNNCGYFDWFGSQVKRWLNVAGESKIEVKVSAGKEEPGTKQTGDIQNGGTAQAKSQETKELKVKASNKSNDNEEPSAKTKSKATDVKAGKKTGVEKELKAIEKELKATDKEFKAIDKELKATEKELKATEKELKATEKELKATDKELKATEKELKATEKELKATEKELKATEESDSIEKANAAEKSDSRKKAKAIRKSDAKHKLNASGKSGSEKEARVTVDDFEVGKGTDNQEEKESSRPGSKNFRTCMTCGLQEPAPKVFKKCKRCKDEDCLNPPYYCGRDCQVLDWTARHRQEHEKNLDAGGLTTS